MSNVDFDYAKDAAQYEAPFSKPAEPRSGGAGREMRSKEVYIACIALAWDFRSFDRQVRLPLQPQSSMIFRSFWY